MKIAGRSMSRRSNSSPAMQAQQILGQQDADHVVLAFAGDGEARVRGFDARPAIIARGVSLIVDHLHLGARHHDVAHLPCRRPPARLR
jgi:hypothetical protein